MLENGERTIDLPRVFEFRRKILKARDGYRDSLLEMRQAVADLAAAVGGPPLAPDYNPVRGKPFAPSSAGQISDQK
jgi:hypothetical protein